MLGFDTETCGRIDNPMYRSSANECVEPMCCSHNRSGAYFCLRSIHAINFIAPCANGVLRREVLPRRRLERDKTIAADRTNADRQPAEVCPIALLQIGQRVLMQQGPNTYSHI